MSPNSVDGTSLLPDNRVGCILQQIRERLPDQAAVAHCNQRLVRHLHRVLDAVDQSVKVQAR
ncbi:MAG: hypothetical protein V4653_11705, partial [Pseudomonadota bacterium]